jgi:hypothetical protein
MIVFIATHWGSAAGGVNAFNFGLVRALGRLMPRKVACAIVSPSAGEKVGDRDGILLIPVSAGKEPDRPTIDCGEEIVQSLKALGADTPVMHWVGHDLITGGAAVAAAERHGGSSVVLHHMSYLRYQNLGGGRGDDTAANHTRQIALLERADLVCGVGVWLAENAKMLGARQVATLIPGFPDTTLPPARNSTVLTALAAGRFNGKSGPVKQIDTAVRGFARAIRLGGTYMPPLAAPSMTVFGVDGQAQQAELEALAREVAGRPINIIAAGFDPNPTSVALHLARSNLAIMPSRHEGFGLTGWEAIGVGTPIILGSDTGLAVQLKRTLDVQADGLVPIVRLDGSERDITEIAEAVLDVARDIPRALRRAAQLRDALVAELGCRWSDTARDFVGALGGKVPVRPTATTFAAVSSVRFGCKADNHFPDSVELLLSAGQGATVSSLELIAELRFGVTELDIDGIEAEIALTRARVRVTPQGGRLEGVRLGDQSRSKEGIEARAGGIWQLSAPANARLPNKVLGDEALCRIEASENETTSASVEVTAAKRDLKCTIRAGRKLNSTTDKIIGIFLKNALYKDDSGHILLSAAYLEAQLDTE